MDECTDIQYMKSNDYASDDNVFQAFEMSKIAGITPAQAAFSRILDKTSRLGNIINNKEMKVGESCLDTVEDMINYLSILQVLLEQVDKELEIEEFKHDYTEEKAKKYLKTKGYSWKKFNKWMYGQTIGITNNGEKIYYKYDVERYRE